MFKQLKLKKNISKTFIIIQTTHLNINDERMRLVADDIHTHLRWSSRNGCGIRKFPKSEIWGLELGIQGLKPLGDGVLEGKERVEEVGAK